MKCSADYSALALHSIRCDTWLGPRVQKYSHDLKVLFVHSRVQGGRDDMTVSVFRGDNGVGVGSGAKQISHDCRITVLDGGMQRYVQIRLKQLPKRILFVPAHDVVGDSTSAGRGSSSGQFSLLHSNRGWNGSIPLRVSAVRPGRTQDISALINELPTDASTMIPERGAAWCTTSASSARVAIRIQQSS